MGECFSVMGQTDPGVMQLSGSDQSKCHTSPSWPITDVGTTTEDTTRHTIIHTVLGVMRKTSHAMKTKSGFGSA